ncbi:MAG: hypothetical protein Q8O93_02520 [bacterium]|nr:hypothetical protein [bacterium]
MTNKSKFIIFLLLVLLALVLYLILTSESITKGDQAGEPARNQTFADLESEYRPRSAELLARFESLIRRNDVRAEEVAELKNELLDLKVPAQFKDLHVKFAMALTSLENYLDLADEAEKNKSLQAVNQLKADYSFLNN